MPAIYNHNAAARNLINLHPKFHARCVAVHASKQFCTSRIVSRNMISKTHIATRASSSNGASNGSSPLPPEAAGDLDLLVDLMSADDENDEALEKMVEARMKEGIMTNSFFENVAEALPTLEQEYGPEATAKIKSVVTKVMEFQMALSPPDYQLLNRLSLLETPEQRIELLDGLPQDSLVEVLKSENYRFFKLIDDMIIDLDKRRDPNAEMFVQRAKNSRELAFNRLPKELQEEVDNKEWLQQKDDIDLLFKLLGADEVETFDQIYQTVIEEQGEARFNDKFFANCMQMVQVIPENDAIVREKMKKLVEKIFNLQFAKMPLDYQLINVLTMAETSEERNIILDNLEKDGVLTSTLEMENYRLFALIDETERDLEKNSALLNEEETKMKLERLRDSRRKAYERLSEEGKSKVAKPA